MENNGLVGTIPSLVNATVLNFMYVNLLIIIRNKAPANSFCSDLSENELYGELPQLSDVLLFA